MTWQPRPGGWWVLLLILLPFFFLFSFCSVWLHGKKKKRKMASAYLKTALVSHVLFFFFRSCICSICSIMHWPIYVQKYEWRVIGRVGGVTCYVMARDFFFLTGVRALKVDVFLVLWCRRVITPDRFSVRFSHKCTIYNFFFSLRNQSSSLDPFPTFLFPLCQTAA